MANAQQEEFKHFAMNLEFLLRQLAESGEIGCEEVLYPAGRDRSSTARRP